MLFVSVSCATTSTPNPQPAPTPILADIEFCAPAETRLHDLCLANPVENSYCCQVVAPTKKGKTFTQFCQESQNEGVTQNPKCISTIISCDKIDVCTGTKK